MLSFSPLEVVDAIWDLIESVSDRFLTYSLKSVCNLFPYAMNSTAVYFIFVLFSLI